MRHFRPVIPALVAHAVLFALLVVAAACNQDQRTKTIHATIVSVDAARDGFVSWDRQHQLAIVEKATTREQGEAELVAYRLKRESVVDGFRVAYRGLAVAATQTDEPSLKAALAESGKLLTLIANLRGP